MVPPAASSSARAFSLAELIVVIAVIVILTSLVVPAVSNFGRSKALDTAGNRLANLAGFARQQAISKNTMTALILICEKEGQAELDDDADYRAFAVLEYSAISGWALATAWEKLPVGIITAHPPAGVASGGANDQGGPPGASFFSYSPVKFPFTDGVRGGVSQENPPVRYQGRKIKRFATRIFMPGGGLKNADEPAQLRLVEGFSQGGRLIYTRPDGSGGTSNYYDLTLVGATGLAKISRP